MWAIFPIRWYYLYSEPNLFSQTFLFWIDFICGAHSTVAMCVSGCMHTEMMASSCLEHTTLTNFFSFWSFGFATTILLMLQILVFRCHIHNKFTQNNPFDESKYICFQAHWTFSEESEENGMRKAALNRVNWKIVAKNLLQLTDVRMFKEMFWNQINQQIEKHFFSEENSRNEEYKCFHQILSSIQILKFWHRAVFTSQFYLRKCQDCE